MSTLKLVLPRLWATASLERAVVVIAGAEPAQTFAPGGRKGPHTLRLVQARAGEPFALHVRQSVPQAAPRALPMRPQPRLAFYRKYTEAMLRRYLKLSLEAGRVSSLIGQDLFRGNVSHCAVTGFDDVVIFVEDVNKCLSLLDAGQRYLVRKIAVEGHTMGETAAMKGISLRSVLQHYTGGIDRLTEIFLERKLLNSMEDPERDGHTP